MQESAGGIPSINFDYFFGKLYDLIRWIGGSFFGGSGGSGGGGFLVILGLLTVIFLYVIFYSALRLKEIEKEDEEKKLERLSILAPEAAPKHEKWELIRSHMFSDNPSEWRLAIIEADTILEELTLKIGLQGATLGDRLKSATPADFNNVQAAWEAHKVRNRIAHDGSSYELTQAEANRIIRMYEDVFNEFKYI